MPTGNPPQRSFAALQRDAAMARAGRTRRLVIGGSALLTAGFAALVSTSPLSKAHAATPVKSKATAPQPRASTHRPGAPALPPLPGPAELGLQGPDQAPAPSAAAPSPSPAAPSQAQAPPPASSAPDQSQQAAPSAPAPAPSAAPQPAPQVAPAPVVSGGS